ncbi:hypothetical protein ACJX0J_028619, partial [Zea mays]
NLPNQTHASTDDVQAIILGAINNNILKEHSFLHQNVIVGHIFIGLLHLVKQHSEKCGHNFLVGIQ